MTDYLITLCRTNQYPSSAVTLLWTAVRHITNYVIGIFCFFLSNYFCTFKHFLWQNTFLSLDFYKALFFPSSGLHRNFSPQVIFSGHLNIRTFNSINTFHLDNEWIYVIEPLGSASIPFSQVNGSTAYW